ncbi:unnamed protein product [Arctia plantaginis]|uniref:CTNNB1 binding N-teminal domain-containing protein n=1 Tax=Arctia plantaginis TaxID=874455 RepID=A0A8S0ZH62_ARCPL|nr:unnamed protein product [Arctia plantaginis]
MPHAHSSSAASSGGDDLGSTDEVKVFKDEGDGEDEKRSSENLLEEKSSLIDWTESEITCWLQSSSSQSTHSTLETIQLAMPLLIQALNIANNAFLSRAPLPFTIPVHLGLSQKFNVNKLTSHIVHALGTITSVGKEKSSKNHDRPESPFAQQGNTS